MGHLTPQWVQTLRQLAVAQFVPTPAFDGFVTTVTVTESVILVPGSPDDQQASNSIRPRHWGKNRHVLASDVPTSLTTALFVFADWTVSIHRVVATISRSGRESGNSCNRASGYQYANDATSHGTRRDLYGLLGDSDVAGDRSIHPGWPLLRNCCRDSLAALTRAGTPYRRDATHRSDTVPAAYAKHRI